MEGEAEERNEDPPPPLGAERTLGDEERKLGLDDTLGDEERKLGDDETLGDDRKVGCDDEKPDEGEERNADGGGDDTLGELVIGGRDATLGDGDVLNVCGVADGAMDE